MFRMLFRILRLMGDMRALSRGRYHKRLVNRHLFRLMRWK